MEPAGLTASIVTLADLCGKIIKYLRDAKDAPKEFKDLELEIRSTQVVLKTLQKTVQDAQDAPERWSETIRTLDQKPHGPLHQILVDLTALHDGLSKATSGGKLETLLWPLKRDKLGKLISRIGRQKSCVLLALENDHLSLSHAIHSDVKTMKNGVEVLNQHNDDRERRTIMNWLTPAKYPQQADIISRRQPGTGNWFLQSAEFDKWANGDEMTLFCPGIPGAGKTMMSSIVVDHLLTKAQEDNIGVGYLYFSFQQRQEHKLEELLTSLLQQLLRGLHPLPAQISLLYKKHNKRSRPSCDEICDVLVAILAKYSKSYIVVDALDECQETCRQGFLRKILDLQSKTKFKLFVTSRLIPDSEETFGKALTLQIHAHNDDIETYLESRMPELPRYVQRDSVLQKEIKTAIVEATDGMFLLATLYVNSLVGQVKRRAIKGTLEGIRQRSETVGRHAKLEVLQIAYTEAMKRIDAQPESCRDLAKQVLSWIMFACEPLSMVEFQYACTIEDGDRQLEKEDLVDIDEIISCCAGLVVRDQETNVIRFVHYTTKEYLDRTWQTWLPDAQRRTTRTCVTYLLFDAFKSGDVASSRPADLKERLRQHSFYRYAARNWGHHAREFAAGKEKLTREGKLTPDMENSSNLIDELIMEFFANDAAISASSQVLTGTGWYENRLETIHYRAGMAAVHLAAYFGLHQHMAMLTRASHVVNAKDKEGWTPLSWAAYCGQEAVVKQLLSDPNPLDRDHPLTLAAIATNEDIVRILLDKGANIETRTGDRMELPMAVNNLIRRRLHVKSSWFGGLTPLAWAARLHHTGVVKLLLQKGANANDKDHGMSPLLWALDHWNFEAWRIFGREPEDDRIEETAAVLITGGADIEFKNVYGSTPLATAARWGNEGVVRLLLKNGATVEVEDFSGWTPLTVAARYGHAAIVRLLLQALVISHSLHPPGCTMSVRRDARFRMDGIMGKDHDGRTPLSHAAQHGHLAVVKLLLDHGADVESQCNIGRTPLSYAAENESPEAESAISVMGLLVEHGARLDTKNVGRFTSLSFAIRSPSLGPDRPTGNTMLKFLLEKYFETDPKPPNDVPLAMAVIGRMHLVLKNLAKRPLGQISSILWFLQDIPGTVEGMDWAICLGLCMVFGVDVISETMAKLELGGCEFEVGVGHNWPIRCTRSSMSTPSLSEPTTSDHLADRLEELEANLDRVLATIGSS